MKKSNCKEVKTAIREHILQFYSPVDLFEQVEYLKKYGDNRMPKTNYHAVKYMVEGGCFLIYNHNIVDFLNGLGINPTGKQYDSQKSFDLYCHLLARDAELILKHANS